MDSENRKRLSDYPIVVWLGIISSLIAIFAFITGYQSLFDVITQVISSKATNLPMQQPLVISANTADSPEKTVIGLWERHSSESTEYFEFKSDGIYTIEARNNSTNDVYASNHGSFTFDKSNIYLIDKDSKNFTETYYLSNGGDVLVMNNQTGATWTRIR